MVFLYHHIITVTPLDCKINNAFKQVQCTHIFFPKQLESETSLFFRGGNLEIKNKYIFVSRLHSLKRNGTLAFPYGGRLLNTKSETRLVHNNFSITQLKKKQFRQEQITNCCNNYIELKREHRIYHRIIVQTSGRPLTQQHHKLKNYIRIWVFVVNEGW